MAALTPVDVENEQGIPDGYKGSASKGQGREPVTSQRGEDSKRLQLAQQHTERGDSVDQQEQYEADAEGANYQEHETNRTTPAPPGPPADRTSDESNSESDRPS